MIDFSMEFTSKRPFVQDSIRVSTQRYCRYVAGAGMSITVLLLNKNTTEVYETTYILPLPLRRMPWCESLHSHALARPLRMSGR